MMKKNKILALVLACIVCVGIGIGGTLAWLTANTDTVTNTFTVGDINLELYETDKDGKHVTTKSYKIIPGGEDAKDPTIEVKAKSEKCYVFACVTNNVKLNNEVVATTDISTPNWEKVDENGDKTLYVYIGTQATEKVVDAGTAAVTLPVFTKVEYSEKNTKDDIDTLAGTTIKVEGFAHQSENTTYATALSAAKTQFGFSQPTT